MTFLSHHSTEPDDSTSDLRAQNERLTRQLAAVTQALEDQKAYTLELQGNLDAMYYSRTWQLMLACREALSSFSKLAGLPIRILRILIDPPIVPVAASNPAASTTPILRQYLPHRRSEIRDWPPDHPLVTVGVPCFNYGRYLPEAIDSVLASTLQDFEILVIDDGSTDPHTLEVFASIEGRDPRIRVVQQQNQGLAAARNKGAALGRGKYIISLDADDRIAPTYLEKTVWVLEHHPEYAFAYSLVQMFGADRSIWKTEPFSLEKALRYNHVPTGAVFRREAWMEAGGFRDELYGQDDWNFWITVGAKGWEGCLLEEPLFYYRKHDASMWSTLQQERRAETARRIQSMHQYLVGQGDSREAESYRPPQDPVVRAALDHPEPPPPGRLVLARRPHLDFSKDRPCLLFAVPWMAIGGAEQVVLQVMQGLATEFNLAAISTLDARHNWEQEFLRLTPWIYHLAKLPILDGSAYLRDLIAAHHIAGVIISGSALAYQALPLLKQDLDLWTADIVHNTVPEGYLQTSIRMDPYLDCHFAVGGPQREALIGRGGVAAEKIRLAPTSADASGRFNRDAYADRVPEIRRRLGLRGGEVVLTYTGRLAVEKDVPLFVQVVGEIARRNPQRRFKAFIAGDGPERARVEHEIRAQGLQGVVEILGYCDYVPEVLAVSRFAFLTSRFEGSSVTLLEAMAMRQVVVAPEVGNVREVVEDGKNGLVVASRRPEDFAARVSGVLADPAREADIGRRARQTILDRYDVPAMVRVYAEAIVQALAARRQPA
jgi:glycosyltransferase involved in cell wall biosynthesis